jgi:hypothetical protein
MDLAIINFIMGILFECALQEMEFQEVVLTKFRKTSFQTFELLVNVAFTEMPYPV